MKPILVSEFFKRIRVRSLQPLLQNLPHICPEIFRLQAAMFVGNR